jgi:hypothetical protein
MPPCILGTAAVGGALADTETAGTGAGTGVSIGRSSRSGRPPFAEHSAISRHGVMHQPARLPQSVNVKTNFLRTAGKEIQVMKRIVSVAIFGACLLAISPAVRAQNCSNLTNYDLRGTYTMSGSGWVDLSKFLAGIPGLPPLPTGFIPMSWVGTETLDGVGGGSGSVSFNGGGNQMSASFVDKKYSIEPDCTVQASFSLKINGLPGNPVIGPFKRLMVPVLKEVVWQPILRLPPELELHMIWLGTAPGTPTGPVVDSAISHRISVWY